MTKDIVKLVYFLATCFSLGLCDVANIGDGSTSFHNLINRATTSINILKDLRLHAVNVLYTKLKQQIGENLEHVVENDLAHVRALIANNTDPNAASCYAEPYQKIRHLGGRAYSEMRPCIITSIAAIKTFMSELDEFYELAQNTLRNLERDEATCLIAENSQECVSQSYPQSNAQVIHLELDIISNLPKAEEVNEKVPDNISECYVGIFESIRALVQKAVKEIENCLNY